MADTPGPKRYGVGRGENDYPHGLSLKHPAHSRQLTVSRYVVCIGTGELPYRLTWKQDAKMPAGGREDGGG
jgi:hypothetical protein